MGSLDANDKITLNGSTDSEGNYIRHGRDNIPFCKMFMQKDGCPDPGEDDGRVKETEEEILAKLNRFFELD